MRPLRPIFLASFFFSIHLALLSYLNSTVLSVHTNAAGVTIAYTISSALSLVFLIGAGNIVRRVGSSRFVVGGLALSVLLLTLLGTTATDIGFVGLFVLYFSLNTVIWYGFDLIIEHYSRENNTGNIRGLYLTLNNAGWVMAPMAASLIANTVGFAGTYITGGFAVLASLLLVLTTTRIPRNTHLPKLSFTESFNALVAHPHARRIVTLYFIIQFFFAWMVLYMIPYLTDLGFSLGMIGIILSVMLLPFVLFQYWTGKVADRYNNESKLLRLGFAITALATLLLAFPLPTKAIVFAVILFLTRVGASIIEVAGESAFFKHVTERDTALISTLRMTLPLAYIIAPLAGALVLSFGSMHILFGILAVILLGAMVYTARLKINF
jgi:MFS family permease